MGGNKPFILLIGIAFQASGILLSLSLIVQSLMLWYDFDGDEFELFKYYVLFAYTLSYSCYLLWMFIAPFYSLKTGKAKHYVFYEHPHLHIFGGLFVSQMTCPDLLFDDDIFN